MDNPLAACRLAGTVLSQTPRTTDAEISAGQGRRDGAEVGKGETHTVVTTASVDPDRAQALPFQTAQDSPHFDGETYTPELDRIRLGTQALRVWREMLHGGWYTLRALSLYTGYPEASISARLRDFRKRRFGSHTVQRSRTDDGLWSYRLIPNTSQSHLALMQEAIATGTIAVPFRDTPDSEIFTTKVEGGAR